MLPGRVLLFFPQRAFYPFNTQRPHQHCCLIPSDVDSSPAGCFPHLPHPIHLPVFLPEGIQCPRQHGITECSGRRGRVPYRIVSTWRHLEHPKEELNTKLASLNDVVFVGLDKAHDYLCWRSSYAPKKLAALFKISFARFSSRFSYSERRISSDPS